MIAKQWIIIVTLVRHMPCPCGTHQVNQCPIELLVEIHFYVECVHFEQALKVFKCFLSINVVVCILCMENAFRMDGTHVASKLSEINVLLSVELDEAYDT